MTAKDILWGRQGSQGVPVGRVIEDIDDVPLVPAICAHHHRWLVAEREIGRPCSTCGHAMRRPRKADEGLPVIVVAYVAPDPCPCGSAP